MSQASAHARPDRELSLPEMLADPIVRAVMARDGVTQQDVEGLIGAVRDRMAARQMEERETGRQEPEPSAFEVWQRQQRISKPEERRLQWRR